MSLRLSRRSIALTAVAAGVVVALVPVASASADPSASDWNRLRQCESSNNYRTNTGNAHYGAYQFDVGTWRSVGGHGLPSSASRAEQDARALILYRERGWQPWQCAAIVGLHNDSDARSGRTSDIKVSAGGSTSSGSSGSSSSRSSTRRSSGSVPAYPSSHSYSEGVTNSVVARWQKQMARRGAPLHGSGRFGATTAKVVRQIQAQNGLRATGELNRATWRLAWKGSFHYEATATKRAPGKAAPKPVRVIHASKAPAWPGVAFSMGSRSPYLAIWQRQLRARGVHSMHGTGIYGANTLAVARRLQLRNGLLGTGRIGRNTWALAWTGKL